MRIRSPGVAGGLLMLLAACTTRPPAPVAGLVLLEHGFGRACANLRGTARGWPGRG